MDLTFVIILVALAALLFFQFRSGKKRQREAEERRTQMVPGTEVMTNFGLYGTITAIDEDDNIATLEVAPGVELRVHRQVLLKPADDAVAATDDETADAIEDSTTDVATDDGTTGDDKKAL
ncbi:preprotein translocase subunit YajC [Cryobacterium sp. BB736]|uniref:preprotein translocase subunit YajC n=1 Tax=Cryobacterium sp. BB736 TaxID=2746963 RepID=UPI001874903C|nr:preprotein translocase subunit YajC [Cryobacterium sp. BB736]